MRYLGPDALRDALPMKHAIAAMRTAFGDDREIPLRTRLGPSLFMPGRVGKASGIKVVSTVPGDPAGIVAVFDDEGRPLGLCDGPTLTAIRTGAASGLATDLLAASAGGVLAMLGTGAMADDQIAGVRAVRSVDGVLVWSRDPTNAEEVAGRVGGEAVADIDAAVAAADFVTTATPSPSPLFTPTSVRPGTHINAIGAFTPAMAEVPATTLRGAFVVVDDVEAAAAEAGDLIQAGVAPDATIADLLTGRASPPEGITTVFKSVGIASQDVAAAVVALERAEKRGIGTLL